MKKLASLFCFALALSSTVAFAQFPLVLPGASGHSLAMTGNSTSNVGGVAGYMQVNGSYIGHPIISQNATPNTYAYYFLMGAEATGLINSTTGQPYYTDTSKIDTGAVGGGFTGMANSSTYITNNTLDASLLTLRFGATGGLTTGWSLAPDVNGTNYSANAGSPIENRIYTAPSANVTSGLYYNGTKLLTFGYTPLYMILDYQTVDLTDDIIQAYSDAVGFTIEGGLAGSNLGLANALAADFNAAGGLAQLRFDSIQAATRQDYGGISAPPNPGQYVFGIFSFNGSVQAVPEPASATLILLSLGYLFTAKHRRKTT